MPIIWNLLNEEAQGKLRKLLPKTWKPPKYDDPVITARGKLEDVEEIDKIMRKAPHSKRSLK